MIRGLNLLIKKVDSFYFLSGENKDANQLRDYRAADLHLCFHICK